ncbi:MAG: carboxylating nicotinate-nucleotide diphosphorylase [Acidobacteria bacterium]|nr:carboxylating nicotinate-nucleotide diphosphorylase [Acidobacteriota bacterium]
MSPEALRGLVERALAEDLGRGDFTSQLTIPEYLKAQGNLTAKQELVVAGLPMAETVFRVVDGSVEFHPLQEEGTRVNARTKLARVTGSAAGLLAGERIALNFLQRLCGIATLTRRYLEQLSGLSVKLLDTRKTTPGLRALEKYAVRMGGGCNHRMGLDDGILIKNNHLALAGGIRAAIERARAGRPVVAAGLPIEVEVRSVVELQEAMAAGADAVLLDNMAPAKVRECVVAAAGRVRLEVSGGVNAENIRAYAETGVDCISVGALTHSAQAADINFLIEPL